MIEIVPKEEVYKELENGSKITVIYPKPNGTFSKQLVYNLNMNDYSYPKGVRIAEWLKMKMDNNSDLLFIKQSDGG